MTVTISTFAVVLILFFVNIILEHLINWVIRETNDSGDPLIVVAVLGWIFKTAIIILIFYNILNID